MDILKRIEILKNKMIQVEELVDDLLLTLEAKQNKIYIKENKILQLKEVVKKNVDKIDSIIDEYNANS
ncbi:MAG: hypothetical protein CFH12_00588 [Alphaproteobacteria bacterium MarineAlpha5_Bin2]|jgi:hypothetical protein|nr:hypothetical protein [Candidatus Pelagibacter sp.]PPR54063.1 MAG: hypothetical protein CFH12_00588 [Alphaproteobacteria bacterium MarineAlpha5_Bin2]|tara:strand:- start:2985 stop:3188 length:204 start_codon:yes stop_codon:yes gene_type:complete